jgi:hypothetical protein
MCEMLLSERAFCLMGNGKVLEVEIISNIRVSLFHVTSHHLHKTAADGLRCGDCFESERISPIRTVRAFWS